jgi:hypothetical protein
MQREYKDPKQRAAVAYSYWEQATNKSKSKSKSQSKTTKR